MHILPAALMLATAVCASARGNKEFKTHTVIDKGEMSVGASALYANLNSSNSEFLLLVNNLDASGKLFRICPRFSYAYKDNAEIGLKAEYMNASLLGDLPSLDIKDFSGRLQSYGASLLHRNYFGLEKSGTVGLFCEFRLGYMHNRLDTAVSTYSTADTMKLTFAPGVILFILPFAAIEASVGLADISCAFVHSYAPGAPDGSARNFSGGVSLNILNCDFGISFYF